MSSKICMVIGLISTILAFICIFLPWISHGNVHYPMWYLFSMFLSTQHGLLVIVMPVLTIIGENLGLIGSVTISEQRGLLSPIMLFVGGILSILSPIAFVITLSLILPVGLSFLSFGFWLELIAGILMLIAGILAFVSLMKKPTEAMIPPPPPTPPTPT